MFFPLARQPAHLSSFTLLEILLVVLILGLVAGFAVPNFSHTYAQLQLSETAKDIASLMRYAQGRAIMRRKECRLEFNARSYQLKENTSAQNSTEGNFEPFAGRMGKVFHIPKGIILQTDNQEIRFYPDGRIDKAKLYIHDERGRCYTISTREQTGYVEVFDFQLPY